ncbi:probable RNA-binding protein 19 isoform X2 [Gigantopelta aegis]|uniref:probable RNA-binding protein 19 isoform X2 n=1 Tax=Gigantopelta aegis TaxID=1735272 RepID=UPI001B88996C|nr:probable RNA-binding protein 19 isoform X2 [Gigantopelta aegis]
MSRLIIKNLPNGVKEDHLRSIFGKAGQITDCCLKFTKDGVFRKFAFIGFKTPEQAQTAQKQFDKTYIKASKVQVEFSKDFGDKTKPRAWSRYSAESSTYQKKVEITEEKTEISQTLKKKKKKKAKDEKLNEILGDLKDDPKFQEFLDAHQNVGTKPVWSNDAIKTATVTSPVNKGRNDVIFEASSSEAEMPEEEEITSEKEDAEDESCEMKESIASKTGLSDLEYLKSKVKTSKLLLDSSDSDEETQTAKHKKKTKVKSKQKQLLKKTKELSDDSDDDEIFGTLQQKNIKMDKDNSSKNVDEKSKKVKLKNKPTDSASDGVSETGKTGKGKKIEQDETRSDKKNLHTEDKTDTSKRFVIKMRGMKQFFGEKAIHEFFKPLKPTSIRIPRNSQKRPIGVAYVEFANEKVLEQAMGRNKNFIGTHRVFLKQSKQSDETADVAEPKPKPWELKIQQGRMDEEEGIAESGRLFVRNLSYTCTEDDLEELFKTFGPLTEVNLPVDRLTKKIKGFAHITFMMPEHAVTAFTQLDGTVFQGRMLHILPGKPKTEEMELAEKSSFKKKKEAEKKSLAKSSYNWNTLFLGANAIADVMAEKFATSKSKILDAEGKESLGVRMALGETQIVAETREFLIQNAVSLDSFSQAAAARSKTVILAKNLPAGTSAEELRELFEKFGTVRRLVIPPSGICAIIEYIEPTEARAGFTKLAYTKFHHLPLYLEWAPVGVFKSEPEAPMEEGDKTETTGETSQVSTKTPSDEAGSDSDSEEETEPESTLFVKNLNFDTAEDDLRKMFEKCGKIKMVSIAKKKDFKHPGQMLSMGYGFIEYKQRLSAQEALKTLQHKHLDGHSLELKISNRVTLQPQVAGRKKQTKTKQKSSKILVRNIPFEANQKEVFELFRVFGQLKTVRLPKKMSGTGTHRGFAFVDYLTKQDAKRAFNALCHSTHLYGRRLVLEWAEMAEDIDSLRKKTAKHFHDEVPKKKLKKSSLMENLQNSTDD